MRSEYVEAVLDVAALIPPGRVLSYGDIAVLLESGGPRQVGTVLARYGSDVPWWRVIRASGLPPAGHETRALAHYREEKTALRGRASGEPALWRVNMSAARWDPAEADFRALDAIRAALEIALGSGRGPGLDSAAGSASWLRE